MTGTIDFSTSGRSVLGLGLSSYTYALPASLYPSASASGSVGIVSGGISLNAGITGGATLTLGNYGLDYKVVVDPGVPAEDLLPNEVFTVDPSLVSTEDASFSLNGPAATASLFIGVKGSASLDVGALFTTSLPFTVGFNFSPSYKFDIGGVGSVTISAPSGFTAQDSAGASSSLPTLSASGHGGAFLGASVDLIGLLQTLVTDGLPALSGSYGGTGGNVSYSLLSLPLAGSIALDQSVTVTPTTIGVTVQEKAANGALLASQNGTIGQAFSLTAPSSAGAFAVNETYELNYAVTSTTGLYGNITLTLNGPQASGSVAGVPFNVGPLGSVTLFQDSGHLADLVSKTVAQSVSGGEQDNTLNASTTLTASNATQLADYIKAIDASNLTNTNFTISLAGNISLGSDLPGLGVKPGSGDSVSILGNGHWIDGIAAALTPTSGNITVSNLTLYPYIKGAATPGAGSLTIDGPGSVRMDGVFDNYTGGTTLKGGTLEATTGALGTGEITFAGTATLNYVRGSTLPAIAGFGAGDIIKLTQYPNLPASGNVHYNASTGLLTLGGTNKLNFDPASAPSSLYYWQGSGALVSTLAGYVALRSAPSVQPAQTKVTALQANAATVSIGVNELFPDPGETYTLRVHDTNGLLSLSGASGNGTSTIAVTGALTSPPPTLTLGVTSSVVGHDQIVFDVTDSYGLSSHQTIDLSVNPLKPVIGVPTTATIDPNVAQSVSGIALTEPNAVSGETYTVTVTSAGGVLAATDGSLAAGTLTLTGDLATVNADLATLTDNEPASGAATLVIGAVDSFGNVASAGTVYLAVNPRTPTLSAPVALTIGPKLAAAIAGISLAEPDLAAGETFTVTVASATGQLAANDGSFGAGTLTLTGDLATVNADLATLTDNEPASGPATLVIGAVDSFGYVAPTQTLDLTVHRLAPQLQGGGTVGATAFGAAVAVAPSIDVGIDQTGSIFSASVAITGGFQPGDLLSDYDPNVGAIYNPSTGVLTLTSVYSFSVADWNYALQSVQFSTTATSSGTRKLSWIVNDGTLNSPAYKTTIDVASPISGKTYTLTSGIDSVSAGLGVNAILAGDGALSGGDVIRGRGQDYLVLQGAGTFDMRAPTTLRGVGTVYAFDNLPSGPQTLYTRAGLNVTIDVQDGSVLGTPAPITIYGNADSDTFNLYSGDLVYVGSNNEVFQPLGDNNTFVLTAKTAGAVINGSYSGFPGNDTVLVNGGGAVTLNPGDTGIAQVTLEARTNFTSSLTSQPTITATTGGNTITFLFGGQTFVGAAGHDVINFYSDGGNTVQGTAAAVNGDVLHEFVAYPDTGSTLTVTDLNPNTTAFIAISESTTGAVVTLGDGVNTTTVNVTVAPGQDGPLPGSFTLSGNSLSFSAFANLVIPSTPFSFVGYGAADMTFEADGPLNNADSIVGAPVVDNSLNLLGGGTYNLAALKALSGISVINASEQAGGTTVLLRKGLNASVNVFNQTGIAGASMTVVGAVDDASTIALGGGTDTVVLRSNSETVIGGSGTDTYMIGAGTAGATITGGSGSNTLQVTGGGSVTLGNGISGIQTVRLMQPAMLSLNGMQFVQAIGGSGADTLVAGGINQTLTGGGGGDVLIGSSAGGDVVLDRSANLNGATIDGLVASDLIDITDLNFAKASLTKTGAPGGMTLGFSDGHHAGTIALDIAPTSTFVLASDGHTGTMIHLA